MVGSEEVWSSIVASIVYERTCAIAGTPMIIPLDRNTAKNEVMNDTAITTVSKSNFITIPL
jgi:hypothetical protein